MKKILIVGSGASGVHFALTALRKGHEVTMVDVGHQRPDFLNPDDNLNELKRNLDDPVKYFLGENFEGVIYPDHKSEYYGFPPGKNYVFISPDKYEVEPEGFEPLSSFAQGGLAEVWTGGVYPFSEEELLDFPFSLEEIMPYYNEVAARIGISGVEDDLARVFPVHDNLMDPLVLDEHSGLLLDSYARNKKLFKKKYGCYIGRSRIAVLSRDKKNRKACNYSGRCLWGCPSDSLYTPLVTLNECRCYPNFEYITDAYITHFNYNDNGHITSLIGRTIGDNGRLDLPVEMLVLAAGALSSTKMFLDSIYQKTGRFVRLDGLMDNRQILIPFLNLKMLMKRYSPETYQYHQIALSFEREKPKENIHALLTTLKTAMMHPIIQSVPIDIKTANFFFRNIRSGLGVLNINFHDYRRDDSFVTLKMNKETGNSTLLVKYTPRADESKLISDTVKRVKKVLLRLGCIVPPGMTHVRPMGASVHYSGTIPMSQSSRKLTTTPNCKSNDFENLYIVDGTTFPFLPAKNLTFTLMANAIRVADNAF